MEVGISAASASCSCWLSTVARVPPCCTHMVSASNQSSEVEESCQHLVDEIWEYPTGQAVTSGATVVLMVVVVVVGATVVVVVVAVVARQVEGAAAAQVIGAQVPPKIPHWTVHWAEHWRPAQGALHMLVAKKQHPWRVFDSSCWFLFFTTKFPDELGLGLCEKMGFDGLGL